jgi:hypothetical protein
MGLRTMDGIQIYQPFCPSFNEEMYQYHMLEDGERGVGSLPLDRYDVKELRSSLEEDESGSRRSFKLISPWLFTVIYYR